MSDATEKAIDATIETFFDEVQADDTLPQIPLRRLLRTLYAQAEREGERKGWEDAAEAIGNVPPSQSPQKRYTDHIVLAKGDRDKVARAMLQYLGSVERGCAAFLRAEAERRFAKPCEVCDDTGVHLTPDKTDVYVDEVKNDRPCPKCNTASGEPKITDKEK